MKRSSPIQEKGKVSKPKTEIYDTWHDEYEIQQLMLPGPATNIKKRFGTKFYHVTNKITEYTFCQPKEQMRNPISQVIKLSTKMDFERIPLEYYAYCFSREKQLDRSIFVDKDYFTNKICYHAFLISSNRDSLVDMIVFLDNYETQDPFNFQVRFVWGYPGKLSNMLYDILDDIKDEIEKNLHYSQSQVSQLETVRIVNRSYMRPFHNTPTNTPFSEPTFSSSSFVEEGHKIQLPVLKPTVWQSLPQVTCAGNSPFSDPHYLCLQSSGKLSPKVDKVVKLYAGYLQREEGYDFLPYAKSEASEVYFVMRSDLKLCIGIFIFENQISDISDFKKEIKKYYELYQAKKKFTSEQEHSLLKDKLARNKSKLHDAKISKNDENIDKYNSKVTKLKLINFFSSSRNKWPASSKVALLKCAWIHPYHRGQKILTQLWPVFQEKYGVFDIDTPSENMKNFIKRREIPNIPFGGFTLVT